MPFTPAELSNQMENPNLGAWAASRLENQEDFIDAYTAYFNGIQAWIDANGGNNLPFGWDNVIGLEINQVQVALLGPQQKAPFNDAFNDVRKFLGTQKFRLFQAAHANQLLIRVLNGM